jgi:hypothetical protein
MSTNFPVIRLTSGGNVYYARTYNWNRTGVQTGALADTTQFATPAGLPAGTYSLVVTANGISSDPVSFVFSPVPTLSSTLSPPAICTNTAFTYTPASSSAGATFTWTRAAVAGISNAAVTSPQSSNPNEILVNTTSNPISVVYTYTISANGCSSNNQSVTVVVNPVPVAASITAGGNTTFCSGGSVLLSGNNNGGTWSIGGGTTSTLLATSGGNYFVTNSNSCGSATSNQIAVTVNPLPSVTAGNVSGCAGISIALSGSPAGGTWSVQNPYSGPSTTYTHTYTDGNGCTNTSAPASITVNPLPAVTAANVSGCSGTSIALAGTPAGGTWSVANPYTGQSTAYTHTYTDANGCTNTSTSANITVNPLPAVSAGSYSNLCANGTSIPLSGTPAGGTFSGAGVSSNTFSTTVGAGNYIITYDYTDANGCSNSSSTNIIVNALPVVTASDVSGCAGAPIALSGSPAGGTWSVANPYNGPGTSYTHTFTDANGCTNTSSAAGITVNPLPAVSFTGLAGSYNVSAPAATLTGNPSGGTFSGQGINGNTFSPSAAGAGGPYTITYSYTDSKGCSNSASQQTTVTSCTAPAQPGTITAAGGNTKVCPGDSKTYSIAAVAGATTYTWTTPAGGSIASGQGTTSINVNYAAGFIATGTLSVVAGSSCGNSAPRTLTITRNTPAMPGVIGGAASAVCAGTSGTYSVAAVAGIIYNWTAPANATVASGQGTNAVTVNFSASFTSAPLQFRHQMAAGRVPSVR